MLNFRRVTPEDKAVYDSYKSEDRYSENSFVTLYLWDKYYHLHFAEDCGFLFVRFDIEGKRQYMFPIGKGDEKEAIEKIAEEENGDLTLRFVTDRQKEKLENMFGDAVSICERSDMNDYVYEVQKMINLSGKKLHSKKNHVNYFEKTFDYTYEKVTTSEQILECKDLMLEWVADKTKNLNPIEGDAMARMFDNYDLFGMVGAVIRIDGEICAMTFGERLTSDCVLVQAEKARSDVRGAYPMINKLFLENEWSDMTFVNREEDMGIEGLRKAKESYDPIFQCVKYIAKLKRKV